MEDKTIQLEIEKAVVVAWADFKSRHPNQADTLEVQFGDPIKMVCDKLKQDAAYDELVAKTKEETSIAGIAKVVAPIVTNLLMSFI